MPKHGDMEEHLARVAPALERIAELERQLAEARAENRTVWEENRRLCDGIAPMLARAEAAESQLAAQRERDGRDAERWRLARTAPIGGPYIVPGGNIGGWLTYDAADIAIDAALKDRP